MFLRTVPEATCLLRRAEETDPERHLKYFADDDGIICVHVRPSVQAEDVAKFEIECSADGRVSHYPLELRASNSETRAMPFPARQRPESKKRGTIRPALPEKDALRLSREELLERGYPPRPDPEASAPFKTWLRAVSIPMTVVEPRLVPNTGVSHQSATVAEVQTTAPNWSGFELRGGLFDNVWADWTVPIILAGETNIQDASSLWVGIDGDSTTDLVQAGTEQDILNVPAFGGGTLSFTTYRAWTQFLPQQQTEQVVFRIPVHPNDSVSFSVFLFNSIAFFFISNNTTGQTTTVPTPFGSTVVGAKEAEWIMERPTNTVTNTYFDLAFYGLASMTNAHANATGNITPVGTYDYLGIGPAGNPNLESLQITMTNGSDTLSVADPIDENSILFGWRNYN
jgi:hypothetical protein